MKGWPHNAQWLNLRWLQTLLGDEEVWASTQLPAELPASITPIPPLGLPLPATPSRTNLSALFADPVWQLAAPMPALIRPRPAPMLCCARCSRELTAALAAFAAGLERLLKRPAVTLLTVSEFGRQRLGGPALRRAVDRSADRQVLQVAGV